MPFLMRMAKLGWPIEDFPVPLEQATRLGWAAWGSKKCKQDQEKTKDRKHHMSVPSLG